MRQVNNMLKEHLDVFVVAYLDNILIYLRTLKEYRKHVRMILQIFKENEVHLAPAKAEQYKEEVEFFGIIVGANKTYMLKDKVKAVL